MSLLAAVMKYLTDRPGAVIYKDEIMQDLELEAQQVTSVMGRVVRDSGISEEIDVIVAGNAWRWRSTTPRVQNNGVPIPSGTPLTHRIRSYFVERPGQIIALETIVDDLDEDENRVRVAINNARQNNHVFRSQLEIVVGARMWRYNPPIQPNTRTVTVPLTNNRGRVAQTRSTDNETGRLFEEVGKTDENTIIIRDDDGVLYKATRM